MSSAPRPLLKSAAPPPAARVRAECTAIYDGKRYEGESGHTRDNDAYLEAKAKEFYKAMTDADVVKPDAFLNRSVLACAEVHAIIQVLRANPNADLTEIEIERTERPHEILAPCANCAQWLEPIGTRRYKIQAKVLPKVKQAEGETDLKLDDRAEFPPLGAAPQSKNKSSSSSSSRGNNNNDNNSNFSPKSNSSKPTK